MSDEAPLTPPTPTQPSSGSAPAPAPTPTPRPTQRFRDPFDLLSQAANLGALLLAMVLATVAVTEIGARIHAKGRIDVMERDASRELLDQLVSDSASRTNSDAKLSIEDANRQVDVYLRQRDYLSQRLLEARKREVEGLTPSGASASSAVDAAYADLKNIVGVADVQVKPRSATAELSRVVAVHQATNHARMQLDELSMRGGTVSTSGVLAALEWKLSKAADLPPGEQEYWYASKFHPAYALYMLRHTQSDYLIAMAITCCAAIGSIAASLRAGKALFDPKAVVLGLASGFIAFISLRGGKNVFLMESSGDAPVFNPYSMAFVGLLVGLFSTRAYALLALLVDDLSSRVSNAFSRDGTAKAAKSEDSA